MMVSPSHPCPSCSAKGALSVFAHYERYLVEWDGKGPSTHTVKVVRYRCASCGRTHAGLPSCIVPYKSYTLRFILTVLRDYFTRISAVERICQRYGISATTLYRWSMLFKKQKGLWLGVLEDAACHAVDFLEGMEGVFLMEFCRRFGHSFLGCMHTDAEVPFSGSLCSCSCT